MEINAFQAVWAEETCRAIDAAFGQRGESDLVAALRQASAAALELVARDGGETIGHVMFSALHTDPPGLRVAALAPVAVVPSRQRQGIGSALIREGLTRCAARAFECVYAGPYFQGLELRAGALADGRWRLDYPAAFSLAD